MVREVFIRAEYNYDADKASKESGLHCKDDSLTVQSQREDADINVIVKRFGVTGQLPQSLRMPIYTDFEDVFDYRSAMDVINQADRSFAALPADVRARFLNDPQRFVEFASDEKNLEEMRRLGLAPAAKSVPTPSAAAAAGGDASRGAAGAVSPGSSTAA